MDIKLSNIVNNIKDYRLKNNDERTLFDWLVLKQYDFGLGKPFRHSVSQVQEATLTTKYLQKQIFEKFVKMGFLTLGTERYQNNPYRTFFVDFSVLTKPEILSQIIEPGSETYNNLISFFSHWASEQKKASKPLTKKQQKETEAEAKEVDNLLQSLAESWNDRVDLYNCGAITLDGEKPQRTKVHVSTFAPSCKEKRLFLKLLRTYNVQAISKAFMAYADMVIREEIKPKNLLPYFLTRTDDGEFSVFKDCTNHYNINYGSGR